MLISTRGEYGLRAMLVLAANFNQGPLPLREIAEAEHISEQYLEQLFRDLRRENLVVSFRGAKGGYILARPPAQTSVADVLWVLEGPLDPMQCVADDDGAISCRHSGNCPTKVLWQKLKAAMNAVLDSTTLADLLTGGTEE